jgi:cyclomaltodextrinase / maltogenic alpha-amylase / neopullulanase
MKFIKKSLKIETILLFILIFFITQNLFPQTVNSFVKHPEWSYNKTIYEVNIRQFSEEGTFKGFEPSIPKLKKLGVGIIWFMPINPIGVKNRKGTLGSYYSVQNYTAVNPNFGTLDEFKELVHEIHKMGMYVILDWVANHTSWDNVWTKEHPDFYTKDSLGNFVPPVKDWSDVIDLNYDNKELWTYMINAMKFWIRNTDVDGFRCDVAGMVPVEFWDAARASLDSIKNVFMLAEAEDPKLQANAFDMTYSWELLHLMNNVAKGKKNANDIREYFKKENSIYPENDFKMRFTTNHDENSWNGTVFERLDGAAEMFGVFTVGIKGMPLLYNGQEAGLNKRLKFFEKDTIDWKKSKFRKLYTTLFNEKMKNKALWNGDEGGEMINIPSDSDSSVFAFVREKDGDKIFAVFNLSNKELKVKLNSDEMAGNYVNLFTSKKVKLSSIAGSDLKPWGYRFFVNR